MANFSLLSSWNFGYEDSSSPSSPSTDYAEDYEDFEQDDDDDDEMLRASSPEVYVVHHYEAVLDFVGRRHSIDSFRGSFKFQNGEGARQAVVLLATLVNVVGEDTHALELMYEGDEEE